MKNPPVIGNATVTTAGLTSTVTVTEAKKGEKINDVVIEFKEPVIITQVNGKDLTQGMINKLPADYATKAYSSYTIDLKDYTFAEALALNKSDTVTITVKNAVDETETFIVKLVIEPKVEKNVTLKDLNGEAIKDDLSTWTLAVSFASAKQIFTDIKTTDVLIVTIKDGNPLTWELTYNSKGDEFINFAVQGTGYSIPAFEGAIVTVK